MYENMYRINWPTRTAHTVASTVPDRFAKKLSNGNAKKQSKRPARPTMYRLRWPMTRLILANAKTCMKPLQIPHMPSMNPIVAGSNPRPPISMEVEYISGIRTMRAWSMNARNAKLMMGFRTRGINNERILGGFSGLDTDFCFVGVCGAVFGGV